jgi:hypothetical protein
MRPIGLVLFVAFLFVSICHASNADKKPPLDPVALSALVAKANLAPPKEQCYLYAELVHQMTELAGRQVSQGEDPTATLRAVREYTLKIHMGEDHDNKKVKNAQILMEHTAFRLNELLHSSALDDRPMLEATLKALNQVQNELMMQVFRH